MLWNETDLLAATGGRFETNPVTIQANGVSIDSRTLQKGDIFIAISGDKNDGHLYVQKALQAGAACAIVSQPIDNVPNDRLLFVKDTMQALTDMGHYARARFKGKVIAITGSVGKTTTKEMLRIALTPFGKVHAAVGSYNNHLGVPLTLSRLSPDDDFCICEIGMNHPGEITPLAHMVRPDIAIITEVASAHLGQMGSLDSIAEEKSQILTALPAQAFALIPENIHGLSLFEKQAQQFHIHLAKVGLSENSLIQITKTTLQCHKSNFEVFCSGLAISVHLSSPGNHLIRNAALCLGVAFLLHLDMQKAALALADFKVGPGRGQLLPLAHKEGMILDESYNASTLSIHSALATLRLIPSTRRIVILGDILELGEHALQEHLSLLADISTTANLFFCCGDFMKYLFEEMPLTQRGVWCQHAEELIPHIETILANGDTLLVKGSHSMHMNKIVQHFAAPIKDPQNDAL